MTYKVVSLGAFYLSGLKREFTTETMGEIKPLWDDLEQNGTLADLQTLNDVDTLKGHIGACIKNMKQLISQHLIGLYLMPLVLYQLPFRKHLNIFTVRGLKMHHSDLCKPLI